MKETQPHSPGSTSRRDFIHHTGTAVVGAAIASSLTPHVHAGENNTIKIALVGCGGRGTGAAANALQTSGPTKLWAVADVFDHRLKGSLTTLSGKFNSQINVPPDRQFLGFNAFQSAIDSLDRGDVVILATPPAFRPRHFEYAVAKGINVFMEKSFAVDAPGIRRVLKTGKTADQKGLKVAGGLMSRHSKPLEEAIDQIHRGRIGNVITAWAYRMHGPVGFHPRQIGATELAHQINNYSCYTWLNGSFIVDWLIHNIDVCCWARNAWPVSVQGMGGRETRSDPDQMFDHNAAEYAFPDGTRMLAQARHMSNCWDFFGDVIHGTTGSAVLGEGVAKPRLFKGYQPTPANLIWQHEGPPSNPYDVEHDLLFDAIRNNKPYNETERCAQSCLTAIMGRMACESGGRITREQALASNVELAPGLDDITSLDARAPVLPDENGAYPIAVPGRTAGV